MKAIMVLFFVLTASNAYALQLGGLTSTKWGVKKITLGFYDAAWWDEGDTCEEYYKRTHPTNHYNDWAAYFLSQYVEGREILEYSTQIIRVQHFSGLPRHCPKDYLRTMYHYEGGATVIINSQPFCRDSTPPLPAEPPEGELPYQEGEYEDEFQSLESALQSIVDVFENITSHFDSDNSDNWSSPTESPDFDASLTIEEKKSIDTGSILSQMPFFDSFTDSRVVLNNPSAVLSFTLDFATISKGFELDFSRYQVFFQQVGNVIFALACFTALFYAMGD